MKQYVPSIFASSAFLLAACGGGNTPFGGPPPKLPPSASPSSAPMTTVAQGTLVDDPSGSPLSGVKVQLDPWIAYPTPGPTPTPIAVSTTDPNGRFIVNAPNATYLLVIGPDAVNTPPPGWSTPAPNATDTPIPGASGWRATIHDRLVLTGGGTAASPIPLVAPTMPPQPLYTPPAVETNGDFRLSTLDPLIEAPCILAWNSLRAGKGLSSAVADEWSLENSYAIAWVGFQPNGGGQLFQSLSQTVMATTAAVQIVCRCSTYQWTFCKRSNVVIESSKRCGLGAHISHMTRHSFGLWRDGFSN